jgi:hypothetical protein
MVQLPADLKAPAEAEDDNSEDDEAFVGVNPTD